MSISDAGQTPEFAIPPNLYRLEDVAPVVAHPDLMAETIPDYEVRMVLPGLVALGQVAIASGDHEAYDTWLEYTTNFVTTIQNRPEDGGYVVKQYEANVAELQFYGAIHGRFDMVDKLHEKLAAAEDTYAIKGVIGLCAETDTNPRIWIERHLDTAEERAHAWNDYFSKKQMIVEGKGEAFTAEDMRIPGSEQVIRDVIDGALTDTGGLLYGKMAYELATDVQTKQEIIQRYDFALSTRFSDPEDISETYYERSAALAFAQHVMNDPEIASDVKLYLYNQTVMRVGGRGDTDPVGDRGRLEITRAVEFDEDIPAVFQMLEGRISNYSDIENIRQRFRNSFISTAAHAYAERGQFEEAAKHLRNLNALADWYNGVERYLHKGGDISLVRQADAERYDFDMMVYGERTGRDFELHEDNPHWNMRLRVAEFFEHISGAPDLEQARGALLAMASEIGSNPETNGEITRSSILKQLTGRLLALDPTAAELGPELVSRVGNRNGNIVKQLYELFARQGSSEMTDAGWKHVNRERDVERAWYLYDYVGMLLASKGIAE